MHSENQTGANRGPFSSQPPRVFRITFYLTTARLSWTKVQCCVRIGHFLVPKTLTFKMRPSAQLFLWKWVLLAWEWDIISISKAEDLTRRFDTEAWGTRKWPIWEHFRLTGVRILVVSSKLQIVGIISGRACAGRVYYKLRQPGITTKDCTKGIKKAEEERWKERRATHSATASLPELILLQLSCAGCLWSFKAWVSSRLLFFRDLSEFPLFLRLTFPSLLHPPPPPPVVPGF